MDLMGMVESCAPNVAPQTMAAIVQVESSRNPFAIGVVNGALARQPKTALEAVATAMALEKQGRNFSMGLAQVNRYNLPKYKITYSQAFDACQNLRVGGLILGDCYMRATRTHKDEQAALRAAFSCYYSGNFIRGFRPDKPGDRSYVEKIVAASGAKAPAGVIVPEIRTDAAASISAGAQAGPVVEASVLVADTQLQAVDVADEQLLAGDASAGVAAPADTGVVF